jgi:N-acyl-D-amino-acid deacylase
MRLVPIGALCAWLFCSACPTSFAGEPPLERESVEAAVKKSLSLLQESSDVYIRERECFSCHHQALPAMTLELARAKGVAFDRDLAGKQSEHTLAHYGQKLDRVKQGDGVPGGAYTAGYALISLAADEQPADETTAALTAYLLKTQHRDGGWRIGTRRPPLEASDFASTALSLRGLALYRENSGQADEIARRIGRGRTWLERNSPKTNEDRAFHLLGLVWSDGDNTVIEKSAAELLALQRADGGWAQLSVADSLRESEGATRPQREPIDAGPDPLERATLSDPYASGQSLYALHACSAIVPESDAFRRGLAYLLAEQREDGSWFVQTRSRPIQVYFESGYPHGKSQFISICGGCWATMAILLAL